MHLIRHIFKPGQATTLNDVMRDDPPPHSPFSQCGFWCVLHSSLFSLVSEPHHQGPQLSVHGLQRYHLSWNHQQLLASHFDKVSFCILQFATPCTFHRFHRAMMFCDVHLEQVVHPFDIRCQAVQHCFWISSYVSLGLPLQPLSCKWLRDALVSAEVRYTTDDCAADAVDAQDDVCSECLWTFLANTICFSGC